MVKDEDFPAIKRDLITKIDRQTEILEQIAKEQADHREIIYGNPIKKVRGLSERINAVEDGNIKKDMWNMAIVPVLIGIVVERFWAHLSGHVK